MRQQKWSETVSVLVKCFAVVLVTAFAVTAMLGTACNAPDEPKTANDWYKKGEAYADDEMYGKAIEYLTKAIELDPEMAKAYSYRGYCYHRMIQYEEAIADFKIALKLDSEYSEIVYYYMGRTYNDMKNYKDAVKCFTLAIEIDSEVADYYYNRASSYRKLKLLKEAEENFRKACALGDNSGCEMVEFLVKDRMEMEKEENKSNLEQEK